MTGKDGIFCADCFDILPHLADSSIDMVLTDPPYGTTQAKWDVRPDLDALWRELGRVTKPDGSILIFGTEPFASALRVSRPKLYRYDWYWEKTQPTGFLGAKRQPLRCVENICVFYEKQPAYHPQITHGHERKTSSRISAKTEIYGRANGAVAYDSTDRYPRNLLTFQKDTQKSALHPSQKPVALLEYLILTYTDGGGVVLDPFAGVMSTAVAARNTGRRYICIERDERFFKIGEERVNG